MTKEQYILDLISQGRSNEEIETLVNIMFPEVDAAPAATTSVSPQQALDRVVAAIKKVKETSGGDYWKDITTTYQKYNLSNVKGLRITLNANTGIPKWQLTSNSIMKYLAGTDLIAVSISTVVVDGTLNLGFSRENPTDDWTFEISLDVNVPTKPTLTLEKIEIEE